MILNCIFLALSASIDALSIGITYGIKKTKIPLKCNIIIFLILMLLMYKTKLFDKHSKYLSLISGIILFLIAIALIFKPEWFLFNF